jgi:ribosome small subunit-dependent GTPase A
VTEPDPHLSTAAAALASVGWSPRVDALRASSDAVGELGRVARVDSESSIVATVEGEVVAVSRPLPAVGDWVVIDRHGGPGGEAAVVDVLPRWSELARGRGTAGLDRQVLAVNVDLVLVVVGLDRGVRGRRLEREVLLAWDSGAVPAIVLTKTDLVDADDVETAERQAAEVAPGVDLVAVSTRTGDGIEAVRALLRGRTAALLGESGAGKSSLVNALLADDEAAVGDVRAGDRKGRHTTTVRDLRPVPGGGVLIDMPGVRALGLATGDGLANAYADVMELGEACRFRDCTHTVEPGCAVVEAVRTGALDADRYAGYGRMVEELAVLEERAARRAQAPPRRPERPTRGGANPIRPGHDPDADPEG